MSSGSGINPGAPPGGAGVTAGLDRDAVLDWYRRNRARSAQLFDMLAERVYVTRPIALRNPIVFYEGHLPGFSVNTLIKKGLGRPGVDARLEEHLRAGHRSRRRSARVAARRRERVARSTGGPAIRRRVRPVGRARAAARRGGPAGRAGAGQGRGRVHPARARGHAPGNAALHVASGAARRQEASRGLRAGYGWRSARPKQRDDPARDRHARGPPPRRTIRLGQRIRRPRGHGAGLRDRRARRHQRRIPGVRRGRRLRGPAMVGPRRLRVGAARTASRTRSSGSGTTTSGAGAGSSIACRCRSPGRCT